MIKKTSEPRLSLPMAPEWAWAQQSLFEPDVAEQQLNEVVEQQAVPKDSEWAVRALEAVRLVARYRQEFTTDSIQAVLHRWNVEFPAETRALGAVMRQAERQGVCTPTDRTQKSIRRICHGRSLRVWCSLICAQTLHETDINSASD